jgi:hypothetical protein
MIGKQGMVVVEMPVSTILMTIGSTGPGLVISKTPLSIYEPGHAEVVESLPILSQAMRLQGDLIS